jgi:hypothetical protein
MSKPSPVIHARRRVGGCSVTVNPVAVDAGLARRRAAEMRERRGTAWSLGEVTLGVLREPKHSDDGGGEAQAEQGCWALLRWWNERPGTRTCRQAAAAQRDRASSSNATRTRSWHR